MDSVQRVVAGRYRLLSPLGSGGMGTVWRADDLVLGRAVAVKEVSFPPGLADADRDVLRERTRREARAAARLDHPSAVTVFDVVEQDGAPYLVMELVEARTLADVVRTDGPLPPQQTARIGLALLGALEAAHGQGIVHRDVKPSNVMVGDDGRVVLTDFGIATTTGDPSLTSTGLLLGSPAYISPERARGEPPGPAADLWSLGATLFTAVEGRPPYDQDDALLTVAAVVTGEHAPFRAAGPLEPVLDGLLTKDPDQRLDAAATRALLQQVADRPVTAATQALPVPVPASTTSAGRTAALDLGDVRDEVAAGGAAGAAVTTARSGASGTGRPPGSPHARSPQPGRPQARPPLARPPLARPPRPGPSRPRPSRARPARGRGWAVALASAAVLLLAVAGGALALGALDDEDGGSGTTAAPSAAARPTPSTSAPAVVDPTPAPPADPGPTTPPPEPTGAAAAPTDPPAPEAPAGDAPAAAAVPAGWSTDTGGAGWTVALPPGYDRTRAGEYRQSGTGRTLRIETGPGQPDAVADRQRQAEGFAGRNPSYQELRIEPVDYRGYEAADWEFTFEGLHVLNRVFVVDGTGHSIWLQAPRSDVAGARADFAAIAAAFDPVGG